MKKKIILILFCLLILGAMILPVSAASALVMDYAALMTNLETAALTEQAQSLQEEYALDVVILTIPNLMGKTAEAFAEDFYDNNRYSENGVLFLLDMSSRQWHISTAGSAIEDLSDRDLIKIEDSVIPYFSDGRYYEGFGRFLDMLPRLLENDKENGSGINLFLSLLVGAGIAGIVLLIMRSSMNTKKAQRCAASYETEGSYHLRAHQDLFLYSNISKRPRPQNNSSGSSTHRSSSGRIHGGRGGRF